MNCRSWGLPLACLGLVLALGCQPEGSSEPEPAAETPVMVAPPGSDYEGEAFTFHQIRDDIYHAVGTGALAVGCNAAVIINDEDVLIVDSHISPAAGYALVQEIKNITPKPVRYVINTHFHFDHSHGNQIFDDDVEIIGHEFTYEKIATGASQEGRAYELFVGGIPDRLEALESDLERAIDSTDDQAIEAVEAQIAVQQSFYEATQATNPTPPTMTLRRHMTLHRGGREIELYFFGRGHTGGDVVVYLPEEKIVATGDLLTNGIAYMGDAYLENWADTLEEVKALEFEVVLPGHGEAFSDVDKVTYFQDYVRDLWSKIQQKHAAGVSAEEAAATIDMTNHVEHFPNLTEPGVHPHAVERAYALLDGTEQ